MTNEESIAKLIELHGALQTKQQQESVRLWEAVLDLTVELDVLGDVVKALAAKVPNLNGVMQEVLEVQDRTLERTDSEERRQSYATVFQRWHAALLHAQRVVGNGQP
ncbi:MAG: hypothetical protein DI563_02070 [Variovorax paradoxus]|uniref:Uncharacterized protein n=1 Tax=Variovorax paradoxus TaxID=34073 RepID=A0A2W5QLW2_VARPD|nr:MAG: hypothetical protein DI563_02070 [Variovorax paradoxus]